MAMNKVLRCTDAQGLGSCKSGLGDVKIPTVSPVFTLGAA